MNQITDPPNEYDAGLDFDYAVWTANTRITMVNVPWNNDYRDIVKFENKAALDAYIDSRETTFTRTQMQYVPVHMPIRLDIPFAAAYKFNYIRVDNPAQPIPGDVAKSYYYFITDIKRLSTGATEIQVQLDVWQTFGSDVSFGRCFIERGHIGMANTKQFDDYGRDYLTIPEGLDTGGEYRVISHSDYLPIGASLYNVLMATGVDPLADAGDYTDPKVVASSGGYLNNLPSGAGYYLFESGGSFNQFMSTIKDTPWVGQGIMSITMIPPITRYFPSFTFDGFGVPTPAPANVPGRISRKMRDDWRNSTTILNKIPARWRHLKKFFTFPYMAIEITTFTGMPIIAKPESWNDADATIVERISMVPPNQRMTFHPYRYNADTPAITDGDDGGDYIDFATAMANFPTLAIVNDNSVMYMAGNAHGIAFQQQSADWSQQKALMGNQMTFDQTSRNIDLMERLAMNSRNADIMQTALNNRVAAEGAIFNSLAGVAQGAGMGAIGGPAGALVGGAAGMASGIVGNINTLRQIDASNQALSIRNSTGVDNTAQQAATGGANRDAIKSLSDFAARGDYANQIAGIQAKIQDSRFVQPSTSGQVGGETINIINNDSVLSVRWKMLDDAHIRAIGDYWLRYGYAVSQFADIPDSLLVMTKFTYWKVTETYFRAATIPELFKQAIRGIFEKGVTVWANPNDIGVIDWADNAPLPGVILP